MISFKCKMCGGDLHPVEGCTTVECEYCGTAQTIAGADNEKKANLFNRANHLRMASEFDRAAGMYESILAEFPEEAEAYWGLCLCAYGIEYVDDPGTGKKIPTCHRTQPESIMENANFEAACDYADSVARRLYREEAKAIDRLQKDILAIVAKEEPYDVFICYKETDESGSRTPDSVLGQDVYDALTAKGMKVFFARITLEDKLGQQYEPYIYAALQSAKVMLAIGTCYDYYNAPWVKNEWGRYLDMASKDKTKTLIPCYKDIDAYDIPKEFRNLQSQDMNKLGWLQDLVRGVQKLCGKEDAPKQPVQVAQQAAPAQQGSVTIDSLMKRVRLFLEDGDFQSANEYINKVLDIDAEYAPAYIGRVQAANKLRKEAELGATIEAYEHNADWQKALRFATPEQKQQYEAWLKDSLDAREERRRLDHYNITVAQMKKASTPETYRTAAVAFDNMNGYSDSAAKAQECRNKATALLDEAYAKALNQLENAKAASAYKAAEKAFLTLKGHKDSAAKAAEAKKKGEALEKALLEKQEQERREREAAEEAARKKQKKTTAIVLVILAIVIAAVCAYIFVIQPAMTYSAAEKELAAGNYDVATELFTGLGDYKDSADMAKESQYQKGMELMEAGEYDAATETFNRISGYNNSSELAKESQYRKGTELMEAGEYDAATETFNGISDYSDASDMAKECLYIKGTKLMDVGENYDARRTFVRIEDYKDADTLAKETQYREATELMQVGKYDDATLLFNGIPYYKDAAVLANESQYQKGIKLMESRNYDEATKTFENISYYNDAADMGKECQYIKGIKLMESGQNGNALFTFRKINGYKDTEILIANLEPFVEGRIDAGVDYTIGLNINGTAISAGKNERGRCNISSWTDLTAISTGDYHTVGLKQNGCVLATGSNDSDQCNVTGWSDVVAIAAGDYHTVGLKADGTVVAANGAAKIYTYGGGDVSIWTDVVAVAAGNSHTVCLKKDGTVVAVGNNSGGQCDNLFTWSGIKALAAGNHHTVGLKSNGSVVATGQNHFGQCDVTEWTDIVAIAADWDHTIGLKADGTVVAVGNNEYGQCDTHEWTGIVAVATGAYHTVGLKADGTVVAVGKNDNGQCDVSDWDLW